MARNKFINPKHVATPENFCRLPSGYGVVKVCVSGAAATGHCGLDSLDKAREVGREIARQGGIITTGATTGFPFYSAMGAKDESGFSIGFSPAATEREHVETYKLPLDYMDVIGCGRIGTLNEFSIAFEDRRPLGILEGSWDTDELLKQFITSAHRPNSKLIFDSDPKALVERLIEMAMKDKQETDLVYNNQDGFGGTGRGDDVVL